MTVKVSGFFGFFGFFASFGFFEILGYRGQRKGKVLATPFSVKGRQGVPHISAELFFRKMNFC